MSIQRLTVASYTCDGCGTRVEDKPEAWAKLKVQMKDGKTKTFDVCTGCCYKIHQATKLNLIQ